MSMMTALIIILSTVATFAVMTVVGVLFIPRLIEKSHMDKVVAWRKVTSIVRRLLAFSEVQRFLVLRLSNGGGDPFPGARLYATAIVNELDDYNKHRVRDYEQIEVDNAYIERVIRASTTKKQVIRVSAMQEEMLRDFYTAEGVKYSELYYLFSTGNETFFCTAASYEAEHLEESQGDLAIAISEIKNVLSKVYPQVHSAYFRRWLKR